MKILTLFICGFLSFSTFADGLMVATGEGQHTINFNFGRTGSSVYLCKIKMSAALGVAVGDRDQGYLDTMAFTVDGITESINAWLFNNEKIFFKGHAPTSTVLHLGSNKFGLRTEFTFCHNTQISSSDPNNLTGGTVESSYQILTPVGEDYFNQSGVVVNVENNCLGQLDIDGPISIGSNESSIHSLPPIPFEAGVNYETTPTACTTKVIVEETNISGVRPSNGGASSVGVSVFEEIWFN